MGDEDERLIPNAVTKSMIYHYLPYPRSYLSVLCGEAGASPSLSTDVQGHGVFNGLGT